MRQKATTSSQCGMNLLNNAIFRSATKVLITLDLTSSNSKNLERLIGKLKTIRKRLSSKLGELKEELRRRWHEPVVEVGKWLKSVVQGYFNYHAVPGNMDSLNTFRAQVIWRWYRALRRRSQRDKVTWERFWPLVDRWIPSAKILHPHPNVRFDAIHPR